MIGKNLAYWVFTSGEEGVHGLDWGVKHASKSFPDRYKLDSRYRSLLKAFSLLPSLERPQRGAGLILLPWQGQGKDGDEGALMGFIFPGNDHKGRPNISTVACVVPADVLRTLTPSEAVRALWSSNDLERIARRNSVRPDTLFLDEKPPSAAEVPLPIPLSLKWPGKDVGYLMMDERVRDLRCLSPQLCPPVEGAAAKRKLRTPWFAALLVALALTFGVACCWGSIRDFVRKFFIQPVCSWWTGGDPSFSDHSSEDPEIAKRKKKRDEIIAILSQNREDYLNGLAGLLWRSESWRERTFSFSSEGSEIKKEISGGFIARLKGEEWLIEKSDEGDKKKQNKQNKLINVSGFKENFKNTVLSHLGKDFSSVVGEVDRGDFFSINLQKDEIEAWDSLKNDLKNDLKDKLSQCIDTKNADFPSKTATHTIAVDRQTLEKRLDKLLEKTEAPENQTDGFGYLSFFYGDGKEGYQVLLLNMEDLSEDKKLDQYIFVKKDNWRRIDVSALEKRLDGTPRDRPCIEFNNAHREIAFFLKKPQSNREKGGNFKEFLGVFLDDLLESVSLEK